MILLTRDGCTNTAVMQPRVEAALQGLPNAPALQVINIDTLPDDDVRRGYPTPTLLCGERDVFGLPVPQLPLPAPT